jgi:hypothetical protein
LTSFFTRALRMNDVIFLSLICYILLIYFTSMTNKVAKMLMEMDSTHKHNEIFKSMVFPDTNKMRETREKAIVKTNYTCDLGRCDFTRSLIEIQKSPRLLKFGSKEVCAEIVTDIKENQDDYLPSEVDGYYVNRMGQELVHLRRDGSDGKGVTGFIEYNDLRKQSMDYYDTQKLAAINHVMMNEAANNPTNIPTSCTIM